MAEVLSQQEIDLLLNNVKGGEEQVSDFTSSDIAAQPFDFRLPNRISKSQLRVLKNIHENFSESFASYLVTKIQTIVNVSVSTVDQLYYSEYVLSVSNPACLFLLDIRGTDVKGILEITPELALALVDRLLGGSGTGVKQSKIITPIEQKVIQVVVEKIMQDLKKAWAIIENFEFIIDRFEADIDFAQITSQNESVLLISFEVSIAEQSFMMNLAFATYALDTILAKLSSKKLSSIRPVKYNGVSSQELIANNLYKTMLPVTVELGSAKLKLNDLIDLKNGDIIKLETKISDEYPVKVANKELFYGRPGTINKNKAIKITRRVLDNEK